MKILTLARSYLPSKTCGVLTGDEFRVFTLEPPWRDNQVNISCIPEGVYHVTRDKTGRFQYYAVKGVQGRSNIEFHSGNNVDQSQGCILVGMAHTREMNLVNSASGIHRMLEIVGDSDFILHIRAATAEDWQ